MKNSKSILALLILLISSTMVYSQNFSRLVREKGLVMHRIPDSDKHSQPESWIFTPEIPISFTCGLPPNQIH